MANEDTTFETVKLTFNGGLASGGHIHLYEYSRSQYGFSRFITTVEQFRRTGGVIDRVTAGRTIDMIVSAPERGSFELSVVVPVLKATADALAGTSFKALFSYAWAKLLPAGDKKGQLAIDLAKIELERERERAKLLGSRDQSETDRLRLLSQIIKRQDATTTQLITLLSKAIDDPDDKIFRAGYTLRDLALEEEFAKADLLRENEVEKNLHRLGAIDPKILDRLTNKLRPMVGEIALPLRRSAERCYIGDAANDNAYVRLDKTRVAEVVSSRIDENLITFFGFLRGYDRYTYRGKIESDDFEKTMYFSIEPDKRDELRNKVISAMRKRSVEFTCATYRSPTGAITSLILRDIGIDS